jgi:hypothetical protein
VNRDGDRVVLRDRELVALLRDEPELLAILDAYAATQRPGWGRRRSRRLVIAAIAALLAIAGGSSALAYQLLTGAAPEPSSINGTYTTIVNRAKPATLDGRWMITFVLDRNMQTYAGGKVGTYTFTHDGELVARGTYILSYSLACDGTMNGPCNTVSLNDETGPGSCPNTTAVGGVYAFTSTRSALTLTRIFDRCPRRRLVLSGQPLTRGS